MTPVPAIRGAARAALLAVALLSQSLPAFPQTDPELARAREGAINFIKGAQGVDDERARMAVEAVENYAIGDLQGEDLPEGQDPVEALAKALHLRLIKTAGYEPDQVIAALDMSWAEAVLEKSAPYFLRMSREGKFITSLTKEQAALREARLQRALERHYEKVFTKHLKQVQDVVETDGSQQLEAKLDALYTKAKGIAADLPEDSARRFSVVVGRIERAKEALATSKPSAKKKIDAEVPDPKKQDGSAPKTWKQRALEELSAAYILTKDAFGAPLAKDENDWMVRQLEAERLKRKGRMLEEELPSVIEELRRGLPAAGKDREAAEKELLELEALLDQAGKDPAKLDALSARLQTFLQAQPFSVQAKQDLKTLTEGAVELEKRLADPANKKAADALAEFQTALEAFRRKVEVVLDLFSLGKQDEARKALEGVRESYARLAGRPWTADKLFEEYAEVAGRLDKANRAAELGVADALKDAKDDELVRLRLRIRAGRSRLEPAETYSILQGMLRSLLEREPSDEEEQEALTANLEALTAAVEGLEGLMGEEEAARLKIALFLDTVQSSLGDWLRRKGAPESMAALAESVQEARSRLLRLQTEHPAYFKLEERRREIAEWMAKVVRDSWAVPVEDLGLEDFAGEYGLPPGSKVKRTRYGQSALERFYYDPKHMGDNELRGTEFVDEKSERVLFIAEDRSRIVFVQPDGKGGFERTEHEFDTDADGRITYRTTKDRLARMSEDAADVFYGRNRDLKRAGNMFTHDSVFEEQGIVGEDGSMVPTGRRESMGKRDLVRSYRDGEWYQADLPVLDKDGDPVKGDKGYELQVAALNPDFDYAKLPFDKAGGNWVTVGGMDPRKIAALFRLKPLAEAFRSKDGQGRPDTTVYIRDKTIYIEGGNYFYRVQPDHGGEGRFLIDLFFRGQNDNNPFEIYDLGPDGSGGYQGTYRQLAQLMTPPPKTGGTYIPIYRYKSAPVKTVPAGGGLLDFQVVGALSEPKEDVKKEWGFWDQYWVEVRKGWMYRNVVHPVGEGLGWVGRVAIHGPAAVITEGVSIYGQFLDKGDWMAWNTVRANIERGVSVGIRTNREIVEGALDQVMDPAKQERIRETLEAEALQRMYRKQYRVAGDSNRWNQFTADFAGKYPDKESRFEALLPFMVESGSVEGAMEDWKARGGVAKGGAYTIEVADFLGQMAAGALAMKPLSLLGKAGAQFLSGSEKGSKALRLLTLETKAIPYLKWTEKVSTLMRQMASRVPGMGKMVNAADDASRLMTPMAKAESAVTQLLSMPVHAPIQAGFGVTLMEQGVGLARGPDWEKAFEFTKTVGGWAVFSFGSKVEFGGKKTPARPVELELFTEEGRKLPQYKMTEAEIRSRQKMLYYKMLTARVAAAHAIRSDPKLMKELGHLVEILEVPIGKGSKRKAKMYSPEDYTASNIRFEAHPGEMGELAVKELLRRKPDATPEEIKKAREVSAWGQFIPEVGPDGKPVIDPATGRPKGTILLNWGLASVPVTQLQTLIHEAQHFAEYRNRGRIEATLQEEGRAHKAGQTWLDAMMEQVRRLGLNPNLTRKGSTRSPGLPDSQMADILFMIEYDGYLAKLRSEAAKGPDALQKWVADRYKSNKDLRPEIEAKIREVLRTEEGIQKAKQKYEELIQRNLEAQREWLKENKKDLPKDELDRLLKEEEATLRRDNSFEDYQAGLRRSKERALRELLDLNIRARRELRQPEKKLDEGRKDAKSEPVTEEMGKGGAFEVPPGKWEYFFGRVKARIEEGMAKEQVQKQKDNETRSKQIERVLKENGIEDTPEGRAKLEALFDKALKSGELGRKESAYGVTVRKSIELGKVRLEVGFFYKRGADGTVDLGRRPTVTTIIPKE